MMIGSNGQGDGSTRPRRLPLWLADEVEADVLAGRFDGAHRLPTEPALAEAYGVSRQVVREAARLLEDRGLVEIAPGRGMTLLEPDMSRVSDRFSAFLRRGDQGSFAELMELRQVVEGDMSAMAAERRTDDDLDALRDLLAESARVLDDFDACLAADLAFHLAIADATHNSFIRAFVEPVNAALRDVYREPTGYLATQENTLVEHRAIYAAIEAGDGDEARRVAQQHLGRVRDDAETLTQR